MRLTSPLYQIQQQSQQHWHWRKTLFPLKATHLERLAQATGIRSAGPKADLLARLEGEVPRCEYPALSLPLSFSEDRKAKGRGKKSTAESRGEDETKPREMRILSIDMGIRNLAFAHLIVSPHTTASSTSSSSGAEQAKVSLNAWQRLDITNGDEGLSPPPAPIPGETPKEEEEEESQTKTKTKDIFSPSLYAHNAYTLLTTLLQKHNPTHILIERQRFRSGGGSAVQEWTLRVGVFEGMLYAVLYTLAKDGRLCRGPGQSGAPVVNGVEPARVGRYWGDRLGSSSAITSSSGNGEEKVKEKKRTSREGKKMKIDLVGGWLEGTSSFTTGGELSSSLSVDDNVELQNTIDGYVAKWQGSRKAKTKEKNKNIGKLDDLADCLVQGMTWLEWHITRERVVREGVDFLFKDG